MPYGITQCYLPPGSGDIPALTGYIESADQSRTAEQNKNETVNWLQIPVTADKKIAKSMLG